MGTHDEGTVVATRQSDRAVLQRASVVVAEHRQDDPRPRPLVIAVPVDVEPRRRRRSLAEREHLPPPSILRSLDRHVVRHDVDDQAEAVRLQCRHEAIEPRGTAEVFAHPGRVDHVVAVLTPRRRCKKRRRVDVAEAEIGQVGSDCCRVVEGERRPQLQPVARRDRPSCHEGRTTRFPRRRHGQAS